MTSLRLRRRRWWVAYAACAAALLAGLTWISVVVLDLEAAESRARQVADEKGRVGLALWQMDSWLAPLLAREAARPHFEYEAYYPSERAYGQLLNRLDPSEVLTRSALVTFDSEYFRLHFQIDDEGDVTSPQVLKGNYRDLAEYVGLDGKRIEANIEVLGTVCEAIGSNDLESMLTTAEATVEQDLNDENDYEDESVDDAQQVTTRQSTQTKEPWLNSRREQSRRQKSLYAAKQASPAWNAAHNAGGPANGAAVEVGPLVPLWVRGPDAEGATRLGDLYFVRRVVTGSDTHLQGFVADWTKIAARLGEQVQEFYPNAHLVPVSESDIATDESGRILATVPARLVARGGSKRMNNTHGTWTPAKTPLALTWIAVLAALVAGGITLQKSVAFGEQRARFASTVTHELRTPLTTFRMYSEMLADGMVTDPKQRQEYLRTLQDESARLSALVENVLAYARLEDGRAQARREDVAFADLASRSTTTSRRRAVEAGLELSVSVVGDDAVRLHMDVEAIGQIVFNLVDNACKYAADAAPPRLDLTFELAPALLRVRVRDHGPGIRSGLRKAVFTPFERGERGADGSISGVGLGLALSRGLARDLGGDLVLESTEGPGASFRLDLPRT